MFRRLSPPPDATRRNHRIRVVVALAALATASAVVTPVQAQAALRIVPGRGEIGGDSRLHWTSYGPASASSGSELAAWVSLPLGGILLDPRLFAWRLTLRPEIRRTTFSAVPDALRGRAFGWSGGFNVLAGRPVTFSLDGGNHRVTGEGGFGSESAYETSTLNATLASTNPALPVQLSWNRQATFSSFRNLSTGTTITTSYDSKSLRLSGANSKTSLLLVRTWNEDRVGAADYEAWTALLGHTARWGKGSSLESSFDLTDQSGALAYARRQWTERLKLQHTLGIASALTWRQGVTRAGGRRSETRSITYDLNSRMGRSLTAGLTTGRHATGADSAMEVSWIWMPRGALAWRNKGGLSLNVSGSIGYEQRERNGGADLSVPVVNEPHRVPPSRRFSLDLPEPDPLTIVVRNADQTITYQEGLDYEVTASGASVRIDILPDSRARVGETVLVSYRARLPGEFEDHAWITDLAAWGSIGGLRVRHASNVRRSRQGGAVSRARGRADFANSTTSLDYQANTGVGQIVLNATLNRRDRYDDRTGELSLGASLASQPGERWQTSLGLFWSRTQTNDLAARSASGQTSVAWLPSHALRLHLVVEGLIWEQAPEATIRHVGGSLNVDWQLGQLETTLRVEREVRTDGRRFGLSRISVRTRRRF